MQTQKSTAATGDAPQVLPRWLVWCYLALLLMTTGVWVRAFLQEPNVMAFAWDRDFSGVYVGAQMVATGRGPDLYDLELQRSRMDAAILPYHRRTMLPFVYPAYVAVLLSPLGKMPLSEAFLVWTGINLLATAWTAKQMLALGGGPARRRAAVLIAFLVWTPLQLTLLHGQFGMICTLGFTQGMVSGKAGKAWQAGCCLALGLFKPQLLVFPLIALCLWRCWRALAGFLTSSAIVLGISFAKLGFWVPAYLRLIARFSSMGREVSRYPATMHNWRGLVAVLLGSDTSFAARTLLMALSLGSLVLLIAICRRGKDVLPGGRSLPHDWQARFALVILLGLLVSPHLYLHDCILAAPALVVLFRVVSDLPFPRTNGKTNAGGRPAKAMAWLIGVAPFVCFAAQFGIWPQASRIQLVPWTMGSLVVVSVLVLRGRAGLPVSPPTMHTGA
jgi:hypothetical protein